MATITSNMLDSSRYASASLYTQAALTDIADLYQYDIQDLLAEVGDETTPPIETVTNTKITLDFQMGSELVITGTSLSNISNGSLNPFTIQTVTLNSYNGIVLSLSGSLTYDSATDTATGSLTELSLTTSWFSATATVTAVDINSSLASSATFSSIEFTVPSVNASSPSVHIELDGNMTADEFGLSGTITQLHFVAGTQYFHASNLNVNAGLLSNSSEDQFFSSLLAGADSIVGGAGSDLLRGYAGNDTINGGAGHDKLSGNFGADVLNGGDGNDRLFGEIGNDILRGGNDNDNLFGGDGADKLYGQAGNDLLVGGAGNDLIDGGLGRDTISYQSITSPDSTGVSVKLNVASAQNTVRAGTDTIVNVENLVGSNFNDTLIGNAAANMIKGGLGADKILGNDGADLLYGNAGNDTIGGGNGNDVIIAGTGKDLLTGGAGADKFYFMELADTYAGSARDTITDFVHGTDKIDLRRIDANVQTASDDAFSFTSGAAFTGFAPGKIATLFYDTSSHILYGNVDGDSAAEFSLQLNNVPLSASDLIL